MKELTGILGIVLPVLIIILGIVRIFLTKTRGVNGLTMLFAILLLLVGLARYFLFPGGGSSGEDSNKTAPISVSRHSGSFNESLENILVPYYKMSAGFASGDTLAINHAARELGAALNNLKLDELKVDTLIYQTALQPYGNARTETGTLIAKPSVAEKRGSFNSLSNELQALLSIARYDRLKLYWMECPDALGEGQPGNWLSNTETSKNPYGQEGCGEIKSNINFVPADTTKKQ